MGGGGGGGIKVPSYQGLPDVGGGNKAFVDALGRAGGLSGTSKDSGVLGVGQYQAKPVEIDQSAFGDTYSEALQTSLNKASANAAGRQAPTSEAAKVEAAAQAANTQLGAMQNATAATINQTPQDQFRAQQMTLANQLADQAAGKGPSLAQNQLKAATGRNIAGAMAMAASQRGSTAGAGMRQVANQAAQANQQAAAQSADLRMQEQMAARQQLAGVTGAAREQDIGLATQQAGLTQQTALANQAAQNTGTLQQGAMNQQTALANQAATNEAKMLQSQLTQQTNLANQNAALTQTGMNDNMRQFYTGQSVGLERDDRNAAMDLEQLKVNQNVGLSGVNQAGYADASGRRGDLIGNLGQAAAAMSDERVKTKIKPGAEALGKFFSAWKKNATPAHSTASGEEDNPSGHAKFGAALGKALMSGISSGGSAMSDERVKTGVKGGDAKLSGFLEALSAEQYHYKDPKHGEGVHVSPMAQDLEKTELGKSLVEETPEGKRVNYGKAGGLFLATAAMHQDRINAIEKKLAKVFASKKGRAA